MSARRILLSLIAAMLLGRARVEGGPGSSGVEALAPAYVAARVKALKEGPAVIALAKAGNAKAIFARFNATMRQFVSEDSLQQILKQMIAAAPIGDRIGETALITDVAAPIYIAEHRYGKETVVITVVFDK